ncbi:MAG: MerR family transcriptional regulator [Acidimicrobiales bacterium]
MTEPSGRGRTIGEVVEALIDEFPDISISKVRYLESKGLVEPDRADSGYRRYHDADVAQLRWVLRQQRDHFMPLRVIREHLIAGVRIDGDDGDPVQTLPRIDPMSPPDRDLELNGKELTELTGLSVEHLADMERFGLVAPTIRRGRPVYTGDDLIAARLVAAFSEHGIEPRHLRPFKVAAEREAGLIEQRLSGIGSAAERRNALAELMRLGEDLRSLLLRQLVHQNST